MRDQIKDEAYFEEFFAYEARRIKWANKILDTPQNYVEQAIHNAKFTLYESEMNLVYAKYSIGEDLHELKKLYLKAFKDWLDQFSTQFYSGYISMIALAVLSDLDDAYMDNIKELLSKNKKDKWFNEWLINFLVYQNVNPRDIEQKLKFPKIYEQLQAVILAEENQTELFEEYVSKLWYRKNRGTGWWNSHNCEKIPCYRGYWSVESAAVAKRLGLDDSGLKKCKYYPYDLAHFE